MNSRLATAVARLGEDRQALAADLLEAVLAQEEGRATAWTTEQLEDIRAGVAEADRDQLASGDEVEALFARFRQ